MQVSFQTCNDEYKTCRLISDLLSTIISKIHLVDPAIDKYTINTNHQGQFQRIFDIINFQQKSLPDQGILFFIDTISN